MNAPLSVLLVDDDAVVVRTIQRLLAGQGYDVTATTDPLEACRLLERERFDVLLSDVEMPGMTGVDLAARARRDAPDTARVLLTGTADLAAAIRAINEGEVFRFLTKPCDRAELIAVIEEAGARAVQVRRHSEAAALSERRARLLAALERDHPGITAVDRRGGVYAIDPGRVTATLARLPAGALRAAWRR